MAKKEDLFSKLNIKDYNNQLENVLENKSFTEDTKNILLNILYKIETAYEDYSKVKVYVPLKKEVLEETIKIIEKNCDEIEIVKPKINGETKLGDKKYIVEKNNNKIISYPNEKSVFYAINHLNSNLFKINPKHKFLKEPMERLLNEGYIINKEEIIRDFDGWAWNIISNEIKNHSYNIVYQNIRLLVGNDFLENAVEINKTFDFIDNLNKTYGKENFAKLVYQISILEFIKDDNRRKENYLKTKQELENNLNKMNNKKEYLHEIATLKKIIGKDIKEIDEKINNNKLLRESFVEENKKLEESKQIFSLSEYSEILQKKRGLLLKQLDKYSDLMNPMNYIKKKEEISKEYELLNEINFYIEAEEENRLLINLQKSFLKLFNEKIKNLETKKEILQLIYLFRYYKLIYINDTKQIKDVETLLEEIKNTEKSLITKACKLKVMNILYTNIEENYKLVSRILNYNIIDLDDINLEFKKHDKNIVLTIYDDETIEDTIIYDAREELNVKFNKRIKLFS